MSDKLAIFGGPRTVTIPSPPYPIIGAEEVSAAVRVLLSGHLSDTQRGPVVGQMEDDFAAYFGSKYALSFGSGTASLHGALFAVGVRPGDEVLTANNTWVSGIAAICHAGAVPVFCDVRLGGLHVDPADVRRKAGPHTKAVIVTHLWGIPADMDALLQVAQELGLAVVEDCSHAHGARYKGRFVGALGDVGCFSLQGSKSVVAGEGGIMITDSERCYQRAMIPGHHDERLSQELTLADLEPFAAAGGYWKYRIAPLAAAIATAQLKTLDERNAARQANFDRLYARLSQHVPFISWPQLPVGSTRGWYGAPATYDYEQERVRRDLFMEACAAEGVPLDSGYQNWYQAPLFQDEGLYSQLWPAKHANGVAYKPLPPGALPNDEAMRKHLLRFQIPAIETPPYMDQIATAIEKVADNMDVLALSRGNGTGGAKPASPDSEA